MKNFQIVEKNRQILIENGVIQADEIIHTFAVWKQLGFNVKRGEKAVAQFKVWKFTQKETENDNDIPETSMFMKLSSFFSNKQVEKKGE